VIVADLHLKTKTMAPQLSKALILLSIAGGSEAKRVKPPKKVTFSSGVPDVDDAFNLAIKEVGENIVDGRFIAGHGWSTLWTRDTAYAIELAGGLFHPEPSKVSLVACQEQDMRSGGSSKVWLQDECGHFGGWPQLSDAIVGAQGAWALYLSSGDREFLNLAYNLTKSSLSRAERDVYDRSSGLFLGCSSFMESNSGYPARYAMRGDLVGKTKALSTNMLHYNGYKLGSLMGKELGASEEEVKSLEAKAAKLRIAVRERMWMKDHGHYSYVEDEENKLLQTHEGLGSSLVLLAPEFETDPKRIASMFQTAHRTEYGLTCLWPKFDDHEDSGDTATYYHNARLWPFVQAYWAIAAARHGRVEDFSKEFNGVLKLSQKGNTFAEFYDVNGTHVDERQRQLWSDAGFLGMVHQGLFGMALDARGVRFSPVKPKELGDTISLKNLPYRNMMLDISVKGHGASVQSFKLDGEEQSNHFVPNTLDGEHVVEIVLK